MPRNIPLSLASIIFLLAIAPFQALADDPQPANPLNLSPQAPDTTQAAPDVPAGYALAVATDAGQAWVAKKEKITTVSAGLEATLHDLAAFLGNKPVVKGAFEDTKDHQSGAASFAASVAGKPITGLVTCKLGDNEAKISVTYCLASASAADWAKLNTIAKTTPPPAPKIKLTRIDFPDGTGSVGIADGWTLKSGSVLDPLCVIGPADQQLGYAGLWWISIELPDSIRIRQAQERQKSIDASWRRMGKEPPAALRFQYPVIAPLSNPEHALPVVMPQWSAFMTARRLGAVAIDPITSSKTVKPLQPGWTSQTLEYGMTKTTVDGVAKHYHVRATWSAMPPGPALPSSWSLAPCDNMMGPDATFDQDAITMQAMSKSLMINWDTYFKVDWERFEARMKANQQQFDERIKDQRRQNVERMKAFAEHNRQWAIYENQKSRNADDWIEYAGGYRTVIDTQTGNRARVDLSNVNGIVNSLNATSNIPHQYVQIRLRDEKDPLIER